jgi:hypothetical protein
MAKKKAKAVKRTAAKRAPKRAAPKRAPKRAVKRVQRAAKRVAKPVFKRAPKRAVKRVVRAVKHIMRAKPVRGRKPSKFKRVAVVGKRFKDRFQKFYYMHRPDLNKFRRSLYTDRKKKGVCVKCKKKSLASSIFCGYHLAKSRIYNGRRA